MVGQVGGNGRGVGAVREHSTSLALGLGVCGDRAPVGVGVGVWVGVVFNGAVRRPPFPSSSPTSPWLCLIDQSTYRTSIRAVTHINRAVTWVFDGQQGQVSSSQAVVSTLCTRGAASAVTAAPSLCVPAVFAPPHPTATHSWAPVLCIWAAGGPVQGQGRGGEPVIHVEGHVAVGGGCAVFVHALSLSSSSSSSHSSSSSTPLSVSLPRPPNTLSKVVRLHPCLVSVTFLLLLKVFHT